MPPEARWQEPVGVDLHSNSGAAAVDVGVIAVRSVRGRDMPGFFGPPIATIRRTAGPRQTGRVAELLRKALACRALPRLATIRLGILGFKPSPFTFPDLIWHKLPLDWAARGGITDAHGGSRF